MLSEQELISLALAKGFSNAAILSVNQLVYVPAYRKFCEENLCGNYNLLPVCPPKCGTNESMHQKMLDYDRALILQTEIIPPKWEKMYFWAGKKAHNELRDELLAEINFTDCLVMSAGPWKQYSCMSAFSLDAEKMASACGMICWAKDGKVRFFSSVLYNV